MKKFDPKKPPSTLSAEARAWWARLVADFELEDEAARLLLMTALESFDRMRQAQRKIKREGATYRDRFNQPKPHPLLTVERDSRAAMLSALKALHLDAEPSRDGPGRPPGS